ncbi:M48 family metallopeptidase [Pseudoduganella violaceinigra]|uniref:M48 family metallopeptidase n=1 Tax=Pseudoduganella violaceinigra TaxID=246602 RepID=UPI0012B6708E|nr:SprT family zinc-dependent metalloprotease [Pseudoduganella violaceinigra]
MDRIRNARHFAPRLQRWLAEKAEAQQEAPPPAAAPSSPFPVPAPAAVNLLRPPVQLRRPEPTAPPLSGDQDKRQLLVGEYILEYVLKRTTRRSIGFTIDDTGLYVTAPKRCALADIDNAIRAKQHWILSKLDERRQRRAARLEKPPIVWEDGAKLPYLGGEVTLRLYQAPRNRTEFDPAAMELSMGLVQGATEQLLKERVKNWYKAQAEGLFQQRLDLYAARLDVQYAGFSLSSADTRWGSCTAQRTIRLNWKLMHFSLPLVDYVVAHELAHILEMNHSARFWANVGRIYPQYEEAKQLLRKRAAELPPLFT